VNKHGGTIKVKTEIGRGSQFEIYLPYGHQQDLYNAMGTDPKG
jgi:signal transduction histidine kinase